MFDFHPIIAPQLGQLRQEELQAEARTEQLLHNKRFHRISIANRALSHIGMLFISLGTRLTERTHSSEFHKACMPCEKKQFSTQHHS
jgi:hypothetical protein